VFCQDRICEQDELGSASDRWFLSSVEGNITLTLNKLQLTKTNLTEHYPEKLKNHGNSSKCGNYQGEIWSMNRIPFPSILSKILPENTLRNGTDF